MGLSPTENKVYFGQLLGMCDQISFPLGMPLLSTDTKSKLASKCVTTRGLVSHSPAVAGKRGTLPRKMSEADAVAVIDTGGGVKNWS